MHDDSVGVGVNCCDTPGEIERLFKEVSRDGWVKLDNIKLNEPVCLFLWDAIKPVNHGGSAAPLVALACALDVRDDLLQELLADNSDLTLGGVYEAAFWIV